MILTAAATATLSQLEASEIGALSRLEFMLTEWHPLALWQEGGYVASDLVCIQSASDAYASTRQAQREELARICNRWASFGMGYDTSDAGPTERDLMNWNIHNDHADDYSQED